MTEANKLFNIGDPVWSKMKGYCPWPSRIAGPNESALKNTVDKTKQTKPSYLVYFFGSNNFAWMPEDTIKPYEEFKEKNKNGAKSAQFRAGIKQIEEYIASGGREAFIEAAKAAEAEAAILQQQQTMEPNSDDHLDDDEDNDIRGLPEIDEELDIIRSTKPASNSASNKKSSMKNSHDSHNDSITSPVQRDYSRTPFKSSGRKGSAKNLYDTPTTTDTTSPSKRLKTSSDDDDDSYSNHRTLSSKTPASTLSSSTTTTTSKTSGARNVIMRGHFTDAPILDTPKIDRSHDLAKYKTIVPSKLKFGFIGIGFMGQRLLKHLISTGHNVTIYNRTTSKCKDFAEAGATAVSTAADVVSASDIVFLCVSNPQASKETVFGNYGILSEMNEKKALVEMSSIDSETSNDISEAILSKGGRYLEAPIICSSRTIADNGELVIVAAGNRELFDDCRSCFSAMAKKTFYLCSSPGSAAQMNLILSMLYGSIAGSLSECCSLIDRASLQFSQFQEILKLSVMNCPLIDNLLTRISDRRDEVHMPLGNIQKAMRLVLNMSEEYNSSIPIAAVTNEVLKSTLKMGYDSSDISAVYLKNRY